MDESVGGLYRYYASKEAILTPSKSSFSQAKADIEGTVERHLRKEGFDWTLVEALFDSWTHFRQRDPLSVDILNAFSRFKRRF